ncbi:MAG: type II toxin-antitoxin system VapC family toxin, partial [Chloroflexota bacterium]
MYLPDVGTPNLRRVFARFAGHIHSPSLAYAEVTAAWLQAVRDGHLSWDEYERYLSDFHQDIDNRFLRMWQDDDLLPGVLSVQERMTRLYQQRPGSVSILHTHDAYYVALAE